MLRSIKESDIPKGLEIAIFRTLQEALNNVAKHSTAYRSNVTVEKGDGLLEFAVTDNGQGFDGATVISGVVPRLMRVSGMKKRLK